jgi:allantoinase
MTAHGRAPFVPLPARPVWHWPNGSRLAVWIVINVEHFEWNSMAGVGLSSPAVEPPDIPNYTWREYGSRVGVWRTIEVLDRLNIPASITLNASVCDEYPEILHAFLTREWEILGHGWTNSEGISGLSEEQERDMIARTLERITRDTGHLRKPKGWLGPGLAETHRTLDLLAEHDIEYVADWVNDEQPYLLQTSTKPIAAVPYSIDVNDIGTFTRRGFTGAEYADMLRDQFDVLYQESERTAKVMCIPVHPFITGVPFRSKHLEAALSYMRRHEHAWFTTGYQIVSAWRQATGELK